MKRKPNILEGVRGPLGKEGRSQAAAAEPYQGAFVANYGEGAAARAAYDEAAVGPLYAPGAGAGPPPVVQVNAAVGIADRGDIVQTFLRVFAKSDFKHDFGENVLSRDLITRADRTRFAELVQKLPVKQRVDMLNKFDKKFPKPESPGDNLLTLLQPEIAIQLYPGPPGIADEFKKEVDILGMIGVNYDALKQEIKNHFNVKEEVGAFERKDYLVGIPDVFTRKYRIGAQKYKNRSAPERWEGTTRNLASLFKDATGGKTNFALLIDASLGMSVTEAGNSSLTPDPGKPCTFAILQNVESDADSATGANNFKMIKGKNSQTDTNVMIMRDTSTSTVVYPIWTQPNPPSDTEHIFSKVQIIMNRVESGEIEASILLGEESHNIPDIGTTSNVKNASLNGLMALFNNELPAKPTPGDIRRPYIYALLKRMGDWCQALSLLDRTRPYTQPGANPQTLQDLMTQDYEVGLVTNDRILLAYGLILGLNVYFTSASDLNCLVYFKNQDDIADETKLEDIIPKNMEAFEALLEGVAVDALAETAKAEYSSLIATNPIGVNSDPMTAYEILNDAVGEEITEFFPPSEIRDGLVNAFRAKVFLSNLGELRTNFDEIQAEMKKYKEVVANGANKPRDRFSASVNLVNLANKYTIDFKHNAAVIARLKEGKFSGLFETQKSFFITLAIKMQLGGRISKTDNVDMTRAKELLLSCRDDVKQIIQKKMPLEILNWYIPDIPAVRVYPLRPNDRADLTNFTTLYGAFDAVRAELLVASGMVGGGGQRGGDGFLLMRSILQREVFPYTSAKLETTVKKLKSVGNEYLLKLLDSLPAAQVESYYRDDKSRPYSVIDRYIITKEDSKTLVKLLKGGIGDPDVEAFIFYRFALLYHDILYERLEHITDESYLIVPGKVRPPDLEIEDSEKTVGVLEEERKIKNEAFFLRVFVNRYINRRVFDPRILTMFSMGSNEAKTISVKEMAGKAAIIPVKEMAAAEGAFRDNPISINLENIRLEIFQNYPRELPVTVAVPDKVVGEGEESRGVVVTAIGINQMLETDGGEAPEEFIAPPDAPAGGGGFQGGSTTTSNANNTTGGSSRTRLYQGLRKRTGAGGSSRV